jgi:hypothetical protein
MAAAGRRALMSPQGAAGTLPAAGALVAALWDEFLDPFGPRR